MSADHSGGSKNRRVTGTFAWTGTPILAVFLGITIAFAALPWAISYVPSQDGPSHLNAAQIFWDVVLHRPTRNLDFYALRPHFYTNLGVDFLAWPFLPLLGPVATEKLIFCLVLVLMPWAGLAVVWAVWRRISPAALLLIPYAYTATTANGNYNFLLSIAIGFFIFAAIARRCAATSPAGNLLVAFAWFVAALVHPAGTAVFLYLCGVYVVARELIGATDGSTGRRLEQLRNAILRFLIPTLPALLVLATFAWFSPPSDVEYQRSLFLRLRELVVQWEIYKLDRVEIVLALVLGATLATVGLTLAWSRLTQDRKLEPPDALLAVSIAAVILYVAAPNKMSGGDAFVSRIEILPFLFFIIWSIGQPLRTTFQIAILSIGLLLNGAFLWTAYNVDRRITDDMDKYFRLAERIDRNSLVLPIIGEDRAEDSGAILSEVKAHPFQHLHNDAAILQHSVFLNNWNAHFHVANIMFRPERDPYRFLWGKPLVKGVADFETATGERIDYVLVWRVPAGSSLHEQLETLTAKDFEAVTVSDGRELTGLFRRRPR